jgi:hypothetical protein
MPAATPGQTGCGPPAPGYCGDFVLGVQLCTGAFRRAGRLAPVDAFTLASTTAVSGFDAGSGPGLFTAVVNGRLRQLPGADQRSGIYCAVDPAAGAVAWCAQVSPGTPRGGIEWGPARPRHRQRCPLLGIRLPHRRRGQRHVRVRAPPRACPAPARLRETWPPRPGWPASPSRQASET